MIVGMYGALNKLDPEPPKAANPEHGARSTEHEESSGPSLAERIETRRFLGREFLVWLWCRSEIFEQQLEVEGQAIELWLEKSIVFVALTESGAEKAALSGLAPSGGPEAREALRQGKMPVKAKIAIRMAEQDFSFFFDAETMAMSGVKIPALLKGEGDDPFFERMQLLEQIEGVVELLYRDFLKVRLSRAWPKAASAIRKWMHEAADPIAIREQM